MDPTDTERAVQRDVALQRIIDELVTDDVERTPAEAAAELRSRFAAAGLPEMPQPWVDAVAECVGRHQPYVISVRTLEEVDVPAPSRRVPSRSVT